MARPIPVVRTPTDETIDSPCINCKGDTVHRVVCSADQSDGYDLPGGIEIHWSVRYQVIQCQGCREISFREASSNSEDVVQDLRGKLIPAVTETYYSERAAGRIAKTNLTHLPAKLQHIYSETLKALNGGQPILCGIGLRAIVEAVCTDRRAAGRDLYDKISDLGQKRLLTVPGEKTLHKLRHLGNSAAHAVKPHTPKELEAAFTVIEHLLNDVYVIPAVSKAGLKTPKRKGAARRTTKVVVNPRRQ